MDLNTNVKQNQIVKPQYVEEESQQGSVNKHGSGCLVIHRDNRLDQQCSLAS